MAGCLFVFGITACAAVGDPAYHEDVEPIIMAQCAPCHRPGESGPFPLLTYADVRKRIDEIVEVTERGYMPPWLPALQTNSFIGERRLAPEQVALLKRWRAVGVPEGDPAKAAPAPKWSDGWQLGTPDLVIRMPAPFTVPGEGKDVYRHFVVPVGITNRRHVAAWQFRPNSRTVHHAFVRTDRTGEARRRDASDPEPGFPGMDTPPGVVSPNGHFASWQPGAAPTRNPEGLSWSLEPGTDLVIQAHLQPSGKPEPLQFEFGFWFTDKAPTNQPIKVGLVNYGFEIPAGATNVVVTDDIVLSGDCDLLGVLPHTHYLGRRIEGIAYLPDGTRSQLLLIPEWDFNWQGAYHYRQPVFLPIGTRIEMRFTFDNSGSNPRNPFDPPRTARFGLNTTDEMAELWLQLLPRTPADATRMNATVLERTAREVVAYNRQRLRINPADATAYVNIGKASLSRRAYAEAKGLFEKALSLNPDLDEALYNLALVHRVQGRKADAMRQFLRCIEANPGHARAYGNIGLLLTEAGQLDKAAGYFQEAIRLDATDGLANGMLGQIRFQQGKFAEAEPFLVRAVEIDPNDSQSVSLLGEARRNLGK